MVNFRDGSVLALIFVVVIASACSNSKKAVYFADRKDETIKTNTGIPQSEIIANDLLSISVSSLNPEATAIYNAPNTTISATSGNQNTGSSVQTTGYLVKTDGTINFPIIGAVKAAGFTTNQLGEELKKILLERKLLVDPIVTVRYLNYRVTVLGEVAHPAVINVPSEKMSVLEALGLAGDITVYGKKENVMLIREDSGQRTISQLNLNTKEFLQSPNYYLKSNDIIYVEPNNAKITSANRTTLFLPILLSALSFAAIIIDRLTR